MRAAHRIWRDQDVLLGIADDRRPAGPVHSDTPISVLGYSAFVIDRLNLYVETGHCLIVQSDGFVLDTARWRPEFLAYDYIGAPWPESVPIIGPENQRLKLDKNFVGNDGFSLRSKRLLDVTSRLQFGQLDFPLKSDNLLICHYLYDNMAVAGIRFAPPELAAQFSIESLDGLYGQSLDSVFGFHGRHWLGEALKRIGTRRASQARYN